MFKLTRAQAAPGAVVIRLEGRLEAAALPDLADQVASCAPGGRVTLDLAGVTFLDGEARQLLVRLRARGCRLTGASMYVTKLLEEP